MTRPGFKLWNEAEPGGPVITQFHCGTFHERWSGTITGVRRTEGKKSAFVWTPGPYLGEVGPGYTPLVDPPIEGEEPGGLRVETNSGGGWGPEGGLPGGLSGTMEVKR